MDLENHLKVAERAVKLARKMLDELGPLRLEKGVLRAGDTILNENQALVDAVYDSTLFGCTIFLGNLRIATRATAKGSATPAIGTSANEEVTELVFRRGGRFRGTTKTLDKDWVIVYEPLDDGTGRRVGMLAAYRELKTF